MWWLPQRDATSCGVCGNHRRNEEKPKQCKPKANLKLELKELYTIDVNTKDDNNVS